MFIVVIVFIVMTMWSLLRQCDVNVVIMVITYHSNYMFVTLVIESLLWRHDTNDKTVSCLWLVTKAITTSMVIIVVFAKQATIMTNG